ncbi:MAG: amino acid racemase [Polaromonas sp.]
MTATLVRPSLAELAAPLPTRAVGILGGMGPAAGADFVALFVQSCAELMQQKGQPVSDQGFPEHWLTQLPVPDRTQALRAEGEHRNAPLEVMASALARLESVGVHAVAMACNTAHAWHAALQARFPCTELLHAPREVAAWLQARGVREVGLLATQGTYRSGLYEPALAQAGITCHLPREDERETLMRGIYEGVKTGDMACAQSCFVEVSERLMRRHGDIALIMGCTEIPLGLAAAPQTASWMLVNPAQVLAQALAVRAYAGECL